MTTATTGQARITIGASPLRVYELVSDVTRMGDWSPECYRCEWLDGATTATVGARFRGHNRLGRARWKIDAVVTVADPGREFSFTTVHKRLRRERRKQARASEPIELGEQHANGREETRWRYVFDEVADGVEVTESYEFLWCPITNRIAELPIPRDKQLRRGIQETLNRIKSAAEQ